VGVASLNPRLFSEISPRFASRKYEHGLANEGGVLGVAKNLTIRWASQQDLMTAVQFKESGLLTSSVFFQTLCQVL
jgi:hypothetical protein